MKSQHVLIALVILNLVVVGFQLARGQADRADGIVPLLRTHALELVDEAGRVRAELKVMPAEPERKMPDGRVGFPESVLFRLIDSGGGPNVKLGATEDGSGLVLGGESGTYVQILARGSEKPFIKIVDKEGREEVVAGQTAQ
jgi:hypothetical protein